MILFFLGGDDNTDLLAGRPRGRCRCHSIAKTAARSWKSSGWRRRGGRRRGCICESPFQLHARMGRRGKGKNKNSRGFWVLAMRSCSGCCAHSEKRSDPCPETPKACGIANQNLAGENFPWMLEKQENCHPVITTFISWSVAVSSGNGIWQGRTSRARRLRDCAVVPTTDDLGWEVRLGNMEKWRTSSPQLLTSDFISCSMSFMPRSALAASPSAAYRAAERNTPALLTGGSELPSMA